MPLTLAPTTAAFAGDQAGATMVEMALTMSLLLVLALGFVDFGHAFYQWNAATKAVQLGARLASISDPVAPQIRNAGTLSVAGDPIAAGNYDYTCNGATASCSCLGAGCTGTYVFTPANFNRIVRGDDNQCNSAGPGNRPGMCDMFPRLAPQNVVVRYTASGLGYQGRPGGAVPTITVSLQNVTFEFFFLGALLGLGNITMPAMRSTVTGEDMASTY